MARWTEAKIDALLAKKPDHSTSVQSTCHWLIIHSREWAMLKRYVEDCRDALARPAP